MVAPRVGIVSTDWSGIIDARGRAIPGGANYIRLQQWRSHVDFDTIDGALVSHVKKGLGVIDEYGKIHHNFDVIIMQRFMFEDVALLLKEVKNSSNRPIIINDLDDWYWGLDPANAAYASCQPKNNPKENINHYRKILELSDVVTVSTPFLKKQMETWLGHSNVIQIENGVQVDDFFYRIHRPRKPIIGWVGSTAHRSNDLEEIRGVIGERFKVHHTGASREAPSFAKALGLENNRLSQLGPLAPKAYARQGFPFDIGLAPLSDIPFNQAKSWIKCIEYAAAGVPFIASPRDEYVRLLTEYGIGRIAHSLDEWKAHIQELSVYDIRVKESNAQRLAVQALDVKKMAKRWTELIEDLA